MPGVFVSHCSEADGTIQTCDLIPGQHLRLILILQQTQTQYIQRPCCWILLQLSNLKSQRSGTVGWNSRGRIRRRRLALYDRASVNAVIVGREDLLRTCRQCIDRVPEESERSGKNAIGAPGKERHVDSVRGRLV